MARELRVEIVGDAKSLSRALGQASDASSKFGGAIARVGKMAVLGLGAAGVGGALVVMKRGFDEVAESQKILAQTGAVLESTGGAANITAGQVEKLAGSLSNLSGVDDEAIQSGENMLLTFTKIRNEVGKGNDIFNQATKATLNMSVAMGKDMQGSAILVGKALNDPIKGMGALSKAGIQFTAEQKKTITAMVETGNVMGAQKLILKELETQFGGSAKAAGETLPGQLAKARNAFDEMSGRIVQGLLPTLTSLLEWAVAHMPQFEAAVSTAAAGVGRAWNAIQPALAAVIQAIQSLVAAAERNWPRVQAAAQRVVAWYQGTLKPAIDNVISAIRAIWERFGADITRIIGAALTMVMTVVRNAMTIIKSVIELALALLRGDWSAAWAALKTIVATALASVVAILRGMLTIVLTAAKALGGAIVEGAFEGLKALGAKIHQGLQAIPKALAGMIGTAAGMAFAIGSGIVGGIVGGLSGLASRVASAIIDQVLDGINRAKKFFHIGSPSLFTMRELGVPLAQGVVAGVAGLRHDLAGALNAGIGRAVASASWPGMGGPAVGAGGSLRGAAAGAAGGGGVVVVHTHTYLDGKEIAHEVRREQVAYGRRNPTIFSGLGVNA